MIYGMHFWSCFYICPSRINLKCAFFEIRQLCSCVNPNKIIFFFFFFYFSNVRQIIYYYHFQGNCTSGVVLIYGMHFWRCFYQICPSRINLKCAFFEIRQFNCSCVNPNKIIFLFFYFSNAT